ncbi:MBL fold metallo-hydrolase [Photobacterium leiognathi]|uniref:MBL fold metallo-hydrolase n=1 Tax=Photobacterium leiognathi TaxID=553611 RepID=UPI002981F222|nr:MBL fold metallo-hydrolase [Photobacterium leiognathi]
MDIIHHGAKTGVTGSCHELMIGKSSLLIDCGLFQGAEAKHQQLNIEFDIKHIEALLVTHSHIDHIGRIPWLLAAGFSGPIYATEATAALLPLMLEDGLKIQLGFNEKQCQQFTQLIKQKIRPVPYDCWAKLVLLNGESVSVRFRQAGHILGSAYIEIKLPDQRTVVFSGDLGPSNTPLLSDPISPTSADVLVLESTYGDKPHHDVIERESQLRQLIEHSLRDGGAILIPAFSVGRTQELLFDIENILADVLSGSSHDNEHQKVWKTLSVILDSPLAQKITEQYRHFHELWSKEAKDRRYVGRHPLAFEQCITIENHQDHVELVNRLKHSGEPAIIVAASGMCSGGRIMNYLEALLPDVRTDVILAGYQAVGTVGRQLLDQNNQIVINDKNVEVNAKVYGLSGYSAHAAQDDLVKFVEQIEDGPSVIRIVHGDKEAQSRLADKLRACRPNAEIVIAAEL